MRELVHYSYQLSTSLQNNRNDFNIRYTDNSGDIIPNYMLSLENKILKKEIIIVK